MTHLCSKKLLFRVVVSDVANESAFRAHLSAFCAQRRIDQRWIGTDGHVLLTSTTKPIQLNSGMRTLADHLNMSYAPTLVRHADLPYGFMKDVFPDGYDSSRVVETVGAMYIEATIRSKIAAVAKRTHNRTHNAVIASSTIPELVNKGVIAHTQAGQIRANKQLVDRLAHMSTLKPDLSGEFVLHFEQHVPSFDDPLRFVPSGAHPIVDVTLRTIADTGVKLKHLYVYSHAGGFGKTRELERLRNTHNAHYVTDTRNWVNVPRNAQWLLFDEVTATKRLPIADLKMLTGGSAAAFAGNCKKYGERFSPRADVQLLMMSNRSLYDAYGVWDARLQRRVMSRDTIQQLEQRFRVECLDGDVNVDRRAAMAASDWTDAEFDSEIRALAVEPRSAVVVPIVVCERVEFCVDVVARARVLWCARHGSRSIALFRRYVERTLRDVYFPCERVTVRDVLDVGAYMAPVDSAKYAVGMKRLVAIETPRARITHDAEVCRLVADGSLERLVVTMLSPDGVTPAAVAAYFLATVPDMKRRRDTPGYVDADAYTPDELMRAVCERHFVPAVGTAVEQARTMYGDMLVSAIWPYMTCTMMTMTMPMNMAENDKPSRKRLRRDDDYDDNDNDGA